ncbi:MAG: undecaprenyl-diphosphate phosphatase [Deltaproteobacteria bacterium]|nr:undecaprenyl-diphosphate phosphatase [Deltaproteobacteria bacterium]
MKDWLQAALLGLVQGLTEFLPVSSSGHLVLFQQWLGDSFFATEQAVLFDLVLHVGTLLPVLWFYRNDLGRIVRSWTGGGAPKPDDGGVLDWLRADPDRWLAFLVAVGTIPTALIGLGLKDIFESLFHGVRPVGIALLVTGALLLATRWRSGGAVSAASMGIGAALLIGLAQGLAITPGISRSGTTIAVALFLGFDRDLAARYSFLLAVPAILGAAVLLARDGIAFEGASLAALAVGFITAMVVGYLALVLLVALVKRGGLHRFTWYVWPVGIAAILMG